MIQSVLLILILTIVTNHLVSCEIDLTKFRQETLVGHNLKRQLHCTDPMTLSSSLNNIAQNYAEYLATNDLFQHSYTAGLGENLYMMWSSNPITNLNGSAATDSWYGEISLYNYNDPKFSMATGHFTQLIWKNSVELGVGIALSSDKRKVYVVAEYSPQGNILGQFANNVLGLCPNQTRGD